LHQGRLPFGCAYGYRPVRGVLRADGELERGLREIVPEQASVVQRIFRDYVAGLSPLAIARALNAEGIPSPRGGVWRDTAIRGRPCYGDGILRNPIYVGRVLWSRRRTLRNPETDRYQTRANEPGQIVTVEMPELRILEDALWQAAQRRLEQEAIVPAEIGSYRYCDRRRPRHVLSGKVFCGVCGRAYTSSGGQYLGCPDALAGVCRNRATIRRSVLESHVLDALGTQLMDPVLTEAFVEAFMAEWHRRAAEDSVDRPGRLRELQRVEAQIRNLVDALADGVSRGSAVTAKLAELEAQRDRMRAELDKPVPTAPKLPPNLGEVYRARVAELRDALAGSDAQEAREAARSLIDRVILAPDPDDPDGPLHVEVIGDLPGMLQAAEDVTGKPAFAADRRSAMAAAAVAADAVGDAGLRRARALTATSAAGTFA
ncbi:MAG TPA: recombinase family protein, partial [Acetobacteraceae bacterium]|nr:recombinase family protein [Acetobacteraceae bacterium]